MSNYSVSSGLPPLPTYTEVPLPPLVPSIPDKYLALILPIIAYWGFSMVFHLMDEYDLFPQYRLHTPAEVLKRNRVSGYEVVRDVLIQQFVQTIVGSVISSMDPDPVTGKEDYSIAVWAQRIRLAQRGLPTILAAVGVDSKGLSKKLLESSPSLSGIISGGRYPWSINMVEGTAVPAFAAWEWFAASTIYWYLIPLLQFGIAILWVDTWQYFLHRAMHMNKWLYTTLHSRHHRLYVPYAFGALYNHPFEGFLLDSLGAGLASLVTGMSPRQTIWFFTGSTIKTVDDHCGYALPWDPLQHITSNNAGYHDVHHQSWGIKTNFSQPFLTFWDRVLGTRWEGGDVSTRYERAKIAAQRKVDQDQITGSNAVDSTTEDVAPYTNDANRAIEVSSAATLATPAGKATAQAASSQRQVLEDTSPAGGAAVLHDEAAEEDGEAQLLQRRSPRKKAAPPTTPPAGASLKNLRHRVNGSLHGRGAGILGYESSR